MRHGDPRGIRGGAGCFRRDAARRRRASVGRRGGRYVRQQRALRRQGLQQDVGDVLLPAVAAGQDSRNTGVMKGHEGGIVRAVLSIGLAGRLRGPLLPAVGHARRFVPRVVPLGHLRTLR